MPRYMKGRWNANRVSTLARYKLGNEIKEGRYWAIEEERKCRLCQEEEVTWEYVWEVCGKSGEEEGRWQVNVGRILGEEGRLKRLDRKRNRGQEERTSGTEEREVEG